jgi:hypothetical protein
MWIIAKYNTNELKIMQNSFAKVLGKTVEFYNPKIKYQKYIKNFLKTYEKPVLEGYIICRHSKFQDSKILNKLKNIRGLKYFLSGYIQNQKEISEFVKKCKIHEDGCGYLQQDFFESSIHTQAKFISGIFTNMIFKIISKKNNKLRIRVGNIITTINNKSNYQYRTA